MLCKLKSFSDQLISPDNREQLNLKFDENGELVSCRTNTREFIIYQGVPSLMPMSEVGVTKSDAVSLVKRTHHPLLRAISRFISGSNRVAVVNAQKYLSLLKKTCKKRRPRVLIVGAGMIGDGSESFYEATDIDVIAFDIYRTKDVQFLADAHQIPLADGSVDGVWIQAVLEHVLTPEQVVNEMFRVLKCDGIVYSETPFMQQVHEGRFDFQRFTESGHRWLFRKFELIDSGVVWGPGRTLQWSIRYFFWGLTRSRVLGIILSTPFIFIRFFDRLIPRGFSSDGASNLFFMGKKTTNSLTKEEIINYYRGAQ